MKLRYIIERFSDRLIPLRAKNKSLSLCLMIFIPTMCNSLATIALVKHFAAPKPQTTLTQSELYSSESSGNRFDAVGDRLLQDSLSENLTLSLSVLASTAATCTLLALSLGKQSKINASRLIEEREAARSEDLTASATQSKVSNTATGRQLQRESCDPYYLLADMSHELRSPLNAILGFAQIIKQERVTDTSYLDNIDIINRSGERLLAIINNIVDFAKIETDRLSLEHKELDFYVWLDRLEQNLRFQTHSQDWQLVLIRQPNLPQYVRVDERRLRQILQNLVDYCCSRSTLTNSITIKVSLQDRLQAAEFDHADLHQKHQIEFEVADPDFLASYTELAIIFDPIARVHQAPYQFENSSLNLPLSLKLARLAGGDLTVRSNDNWIGIIFNLAIEVETTDAKNVRIQPARRRVIGLESDRAEYRILVVDDSKVNRAIMSHLLEPVGFKVREAVNGREAIDVWSNWQPHMIWMDLKMPVMNGFEATELIRERSQTSHTPIVALSASTLEEEQLLLDAAGCDDFVGKPFSENTIFDKIAQYLGIRYVYESIESTTASSIKLTPETLSVMPKQWLERVESAAIVLDRQRLTQLLEEIPAEQAELKNVLQQQIDNFDFDNILSQIANISK